MRPSSKNIEYCLNLYNTDTLRCVVANTGGVVTGGDGNSRPSRHPDSWKYRHL